MIVLWCVAGASLVVALATWYQTRRIARRLEQLSQMYWALKYQHGELRSELQRASGDAPIEARPHAAPDAGHAFVPLASLKR
jgi:hypothetical protein